MRITAKMVPESAGLVGDLSVSGKIVRVFDKKLGESEKGKWSFQNFIVQDETGEMTVCLKNRKEDIKKEDVGKSISVASSQTKNGILGVKIDKEEYTDKDNKPQTIIKVVITPSASFNLEGVGKPSESATPDIEVEPVDLDTLRKDTIEISLKAWREVLQPELSDATNPAYKEIMSAMILAAGRNADSLFIARTRE